MCASKHQNQFPTLMALHLFISGICTEYLLCVSCFVSLFAWFIEAPHPPLASNAIQTYFHLRCTKTTVSIYEGRPAISILVLLLFQMKLYSINTLCCPGIFSFKMFKVVYFIGVFQHVIITCIEKYQFSLQSPPTYTTLF